MTCIREIIEKHIVEAEGRAKRLGNEHEAARFELMGPYPPAPGEMRAWHAYNARQDALPLADRERLERLQRTAQDASHHAESLRHHLRSRLANGWLNKLPPWAVSQSSESRCRVITPPVLGAIERWTPSTNLVLLGPTGCGKSIGAAHAIMRLVAESIGSVEQLPPLKWVQATVLERARREHQLGNGEPPLVAQASNAGVLVLDDLAQEQARGDTAIWDVVNERYNRSAPIIVTSGLNPAELTSRYGAAFVRRLNQDGRAIVGNAFPKQAAA